MIAKRVPMNSVKKSSFIGLVSYITSSQTKTERVGAVTISNCHAEDPLWAAREIKATQDQNTRSLTDKTYHLILSFRAGENPPAETLAAIEARICAGLGYGEHQRVSAVHTDTDNLHIHIAINKIHPERLTIHEPYYDHPKLAALCEKLEREFGLQPDNHVPARSAGQAKAADMEANAGIESLLGWVKRECEPQLQTAQSWDAFQKTLAEHGLQIQKRGNGLVISDKAGNMLKASSLGREFSKQKLEGRFGAFPDEKPNKTAEQPRKEYRDRPVPSRIDTTELYAQFQNEQKTNSFERSGALKNARARKQENIDAVKRRAKLKRDAMKLTKGRVVKKVLYATINKTMRSDIERVNKSYQAEREAINSKFQRNDWITWLAHKAGQGEQEALAVLRARQTKAPLRGNTVSTAEPGIAAGLAAGATVDSITKKGTAIYRVGSTTVRDDGARLSVAKGAEKNALEAVLRMAVERYGNTLTITGSQAFKQALATVAIEAKLDITFKTIPIKPEQNNDRNNANLPRKPGVAAIGRKPPPDRKHRLRGLSELSVVRVTSGGEVLLPSNVPRNLEHERARGDNALRRPSVGAGIKPEQWVAADQYINERNQRRQNIFDIPEHTRYNGKETDTFTYAGQRAINGQSLVLLKNEKAVLVLPVDSAVALRLERVRVGASVSVSETGNVQPKGRKR